MNFNSILIGSENPGALNDYYTKLFGAPGFDDGGYSGWQIGSGFLTIGPHDEVHGKNATPGRIIVNIESADVLGDFAKLKAAGAIVVREPYSFERPGPGHVDRHPGRPRRQLLPARQPDADVAPGAAPRAARGALSACPGRRSSAPGTRRWTGRLARARSFARARLQMSSTEVKQASNAYPASE